MLGNTHPKSTSAWKSARSVGISLVRGRKTRRRTAAAFRDARKRDLRGGIYPGPLANQRVPDGGWRYVPAFLGTNCIGCQDMKPFRVLHLTQLQGTEESPPQYHPCGPPRSRNGLCTV